MGRTSYKQIYLHAHADSTMRSYTNLHESCAWIVLCSPHAWIVLRSPHAWIVLRIPIQIHVTLHRSMSFLLSPCTNLALHRVSYSARGTSCVQEARYSVCLCRCLQKAGALVHTSTVPLYASLDACADSKLFSRCARLASFRSILTVHVIKHTISLTQILSRFLCALVRMQK